MYKRQAYNLITGNYTNTGNTIEGVGSGQEVFSDFSLNGSDWTDFQTTLISNNNDWWNSSNTTTPFAVPVPAVGTMTDFATWQADTSQDLIGSTFSAPSGDPFATCNSVTPPAADYWLTVDNNSVSVDPTSTAVYNLTVTSLAGFSGTVNLAIDGITEVKGCLLYTSGALHSFRPSEEFLMRDLGRGGYAAETSLHR